jgi:hypothetical protein
VYNSKIKIFKHTVSKNYMINYFLKFYIFHMMFLILIYVLNLSLLFNVEFSYFNLINYTKLIFGLKILICIFFFFFFFTIFNFFKYENLGFYF